MKNLIVGSVFAVLSSLTGCIFVSDDTTTPPVDDPCASPAAGEFCNTAKWTFVNMSDVGVASPTACPGGQFDTVAHISQAVNANGVPVGSCGPNSPSGTCFVDLYTCSDNTGHDVLPAGSYLQWLAVTNATGTETYANSIGAIVTIGAASTFEAAIINNGGYFQYDWQLETAGGTPATCADVPAENGVAMASTLASNSHLFDDAFDCEDGTAISGGLPAGGYTMELALVNAANQALGTAPVLSNKTIAPQNKVTDLGMLTITLN